MSKKVRQHRSSVKQSKKKILQTKKQRKLHNASKQLQSKKGLPIPSVTLMVTKSKEIIHEVESKLLCFSELILLTLDFKYKNEDSPIQLTETNAEEFNATIYGKKELFKQKLLELSQIVLEFKHHLSKFDTIPTEEIDKTYIGTTIEGQNEFFKLASYISETQIKMQNLQTLYKDPLLMDFIKTMNEEGIPEEVIQNVLTITEMVKEQMEDGTIEESLKAAEEQLKQLEQNEQETTEQLQEMQDTLKELEQSISTEEVTESAEDTTSASNTTEEVNLEIKEELADPPFEIHLPKF
jgi:DNA-binding transcriptional MerR regulator